MSTVEMKVPAIGESITEVTLSQWLKEDGAFVEMDEPICEFESDKATLELPAEAAGKLIHLAKEGDDLAIGAPIANIETTADKPEKASERQSVSTELEANVQSDETKDHPAESRGEIASPAAAKLMREKNLTAEDISGTGKDGRITKQDVLSAGLISSKETKEPAAIPPVQKEMFERSTRREKMSRMRRTIAKRLVSAKNQTAMLTTFNEVDMSGIINLRKTYQDRFVEKYGIKLGFMSLFAKACSQILLEMPEVNAKLEDDELVYHNFVDISIAISTPTGLVVPPVQHVESLSLSEIEFKIKELAEKARNGTLSLEEMTGGTFTITNGGIFGSLLSTPIINEPQSAILGMHAINDRPVAVNGEIQIRPMMYLALSYDHRVIDGSSSVTFLVKVKQLLEDPVSLLLGV